MYDLICTWVYDGVFLTEGDPGIPPFPLRPLDFQVAFFNCQQGDALVVSRVKFCQVLDVDKEKCIEWGCIDKDIAILQHNYTPE